MLLKRFLTKREALLTASIGLFVLIELWTSPPRFFDAKNNNDSSVIMKQQEYDPLWQFIPADSKEIRKWGCNRTETPTIFVHIGKYKTRAICFTTTGSFFLSRIAPYRQVWRRQCRCKNRRLVFQLYKDEA
jgi:hypothetical protein